MEPLILRIASTSPTELELSRRDQPTSEDFPPRPVLRRGQSVDGPNTRLTEVARETLDDE